MKYEIIGGTVPYVEITLDNNHSLYTQRGGMCWRDEEIEMQTNSKNGFLGGLTRMISGDSFFMNTYIARKNGVKIAFASTVPGEIVPIDLTNHPGIIAQKGAFLCAEDSVKFEVTLTKKFGAGLFGGEGFVLQDIHGSGMAFLEVDGNICKKELKAGESILIDTGNIVYFDKTCTYSIETVKGFKNVLFGGEGFFLTKITGPGVVVMQSQNLRDFANRLIPFLPTSKNND